MITLLLTYIRDLRTYTTSRHSFQGGGHIGREGRSFEVEKTENDEQEQCEFCASKLTSYEIKLRLATRNERQRALRSLNTVFHRRYG